MSTMKEPTSPVLLVDVRKLPFKRVSTTDVPDV
jgi:hypothetical protein